MEEKYLTTDIQAVNSTLEQRRQIIFFWDSYLATNSSLVLLKDQKKDGRSSETQVSYLDTVRKKPWGISCKYQKKISIVLAY